MVGQIQPANIFEAMNRGLEIGRRRRNEDAFAAAVGAHGVGSEQAVNALAALNPMGASQMAQQGRQFDARMEQDASQFGAQMGLRREQFAADQAHRAATLSLQRQQLLIQRSNAARAASGAQGARRREVAAALLGQVLSMPEAERTQGYAVALQQAQAAGLSLENIPPEYPGGAAVTALYNVVSGKTWEAAAGPEWRATTPEEAAQYGRPGQMNTRTGQYKAGPGGGLSVTTPDGTSVTMGGPQKLTEGQSKDVVYANRMAGASDALANVELALTSLPDKVAGGVPLLGNYLTSEEYKLGVQAGQEWLSAALRKDSGAALTESDVNIYNDLYLPQPGDTTAVVAQKRQSRARAEEGIRAGLGLAQATMEILDERRAAVGRAGAARRGETLPADPPPDGIDQETWDFMSEEDKALWRN